MSEEKKTARIFIVNCAGEEEPVYLVCTQEFMDRYYDPETGDLFPLIESIVPDQALSEQLKHDMEAIKLYDAMKGTPNAGSPSVQNQQFHCPPSAAAWGVMPSAYVGPMGVPVVHNVGDDIVFNKVDFNPPLHITDKIDPASYYQLPYPQIKIDVTQIPDKIEIKFPPKRLWRATCREKVEATDKCSGYWKTFRVYLIADSMRAALDRIALLDCTHIERVDMDEDRVLM